MGLDYVELRVESDNRCEGCQGSAQNSHGIETFLNRVSICEIRSGA